MVCRWDCVVPGLLLLYEVEDDKGEERGGASGGGVEGEDGKGARESESFGEGDDFEGEVRYEEDKWSSGRAVGGYTER